MQRLLHAIGVDRSPGLNWRVDIAEIPLIGRYLPGGVQIDLVKQQIELLLSKIRIDN